MHPFLGVGEVVKREEKEDDEISGNAREHGELVDVVLDERVHVPVSSTASASSTSQPRSVSSL